MIHIPDLTLERLLDRAEALARRRAAGRTTIAPLAYAADAKGYVTVIGFPAPHDEEDRGALAALLLMEMRKRQATMAVLALDAVVVTGNLAARCIVLEGRQLRPVARTEVRLLAIQRTGVVMSTEAGVRPQVPSW